LTQVALAAVRDYRIPNPAGIYQSLNFKVDIPYSEAVCNSKSIPETPVKSVPSPTENIPSPSPTPRSSARKPTSKEEFLNNLKFQTPKIGASPSPSSKVPSVLDGVNVQRSEPLPSLSPVVPEGAPKSP
jgi:hypothetical protein